MEETERFMKAMGLDQTHQWVRLPDTLEEYYNGAAKRFAGIQVLRLHFDDECSFAISSGTMKGEFTFLRAFLADHEGRLHVDIDAAGDSVRLALYFPSYHYGFVEDTFARAIHHKIEGIGYACRECVGKYELRLREYDRLFRLASEEDLNAAIWMALCRLLCPIDLAATHREAYETYLRKHDKELLLLLAQHEGDRSEWIELVTGQKLLSDEAIEFILPELTQTDHAPMVAALLAARSKGKRRTRLII